jgi:hypothetical protein
MEKGLVRIEKKDKNGANFGLLETFFYICE